MMKKMFFLILSIGMIILSGCVKQNYKRIISEEGVEWGREPVILDSAPYEINLELGTSDIFYPSFFHKGYIYGHIKKLHGEDLIDRKYLYRIDVNNKISETIKENFNSLSGLKPIGLYNNQVYTVDYSRGNKISPLTNLSLLLSNNRYSKLENQYIMTYVTGSENYILVHEYSPNNKLIKTYIYDLDLNKTYIKLSEKKYGEVVYVRDLNSLIWIDQEDFKIYKINLINKHYVLEEYMDLGVDEGIDRVRAYINNGYELVLLFDSKIGNKENWDLMETREVRSYRFRNSEYQTLFKKSTDKNLYMEYLGDNILISETFEVLDDYIEITERQVFHYDYKDLYPIYSEAFMERSQQLYPEINVIASRTSNEMFSTREIKEIIDGIPVTKRVIYQRIKLGIGKERLLE